MKKKELYKVAVNNQTTAHSFKHALISIGENVCHEFFDVYEKEMVLIFSIGDDEWMLVNKTHSAIGERKFIEFKELLSFLVYEYKPKSILDGKCAIQVNNEREFEMLMKHYEEKEWSWKDGDKSVTEEEKWDGQCDAVSYHDKCFWVDGISIFKSKTQGYTIIPFQHFAKEVGIEVPKEIEHVTDRGIKCQILNDEVLIHCSCGCFSISPKDIEAIHNAIQQLKGGENA